MPEISIIIPAYKTEKYIHRCLDSILAQTFTDFELILVDDGSPDRSGSICDEYAEKDGRIRVFHQENKGQAAARNLGIDWVMTHSDSEWICFVDSDDWIHPQYLEALYSGARANQTEISLCNIKRVEGYEKGEPFTLECKVMPSTEVYEWFVHETVNVGPWAKLIKKRLFADIRFPEGKLWEDLATTYKLILSVSSCAVIEEELYFYFSNPLGTIQKPWTPRKLDELTAYEEQLVFFKDKEEYKRIYYALQNRYVVALGYQYFMIRESEAPDRLNYLRLVSRKTRYSLIKYRKHLDLPFSKHKDVYEAAYPQLMNWYWRFRALKAKILKGKE